GLREMPGRKAVILFSDGIEMLNNRGSRNDRIIEAINRLTDLANRASVVVYTIDARGLQTLSLTAADNTAGLSPEAIQRAMSERRRGFEESQNGLVYLAEQTGGFAIRNSNDISHGIRRIIEDQRGYYLIGYRPDAQTFDPASGRRNFHRLTAKVKRPGLRVRLRSGFYGITEEAKRAAPRTRSEQMIAALNTPFQQGGVGLRLTTLFADDQKQGLFMRSMLHINARDLTFVAQPDGWQKAVIDVLAVTFVENGSLVDEVNTTHTMRTRGKTYEYILKNGLVFNLNVPIKKPGAYQFRIAVRDTASERAGAASQFIEVPNLSKNRLALSGIVLLNADTGAAATQATAPANGTGAGEEGASDPQSGPAVRRFRRGSTVDYYYYIYNAKLDKQSASPQIQTQVRLFRDGQPVFTGPALPFDASKQPDMKRVLAGARMRLGPELTPGEYLLQVVVTDALAKEKERTATQWIDFEIVE
ncbi:MAG TPA: VWA domain-containing protein, partial [Pyrinomonadaceae bacterium]|nr:VWA domain-containing protein [Pyrinomonadaceae bacterium]